MIQEAQLKQILIQSGILDKRQVEKAVDYSHSSGAIFEDALVELYYIDESTLGDLYAKHYHLPYVHLPMLKKENLPLNFFSKDLASALEVLPLAYQKDNRILTLVTWRPNDKSLLQKIKQNLQSSMTLRLTVAPRREIVEGIQKFYGMSSASPEKRIKIELPDSFQIIEDSLVHEPIITAGNLKSDHRADQVLIIEPNHKIRNPLRSLLEAYQYDVDLTLDDRSALEMIEQKKYDFIIRRRVTQGRSMVLEKRLKERHKDIKLCFIDEFDKLITGSTLIYEEMSEAYLNTVFQLIKIMLCAEKALLKKISIMARYAKVIAMRLNMPKSKIDGLIAAVYLSSLGKSQFLKQALLSNGKSIINTNNPRELCANLCLSLKTPFALSNILSEWAKLAEGHAVEHIEAKILNVLDYFLESFTFDATDKIKNSINEIKTSLREMFSDGESGRITECLIKILSDEVYLSDLEETNQSILIIDKEMNHSSELVLRFQNDGYAINLSSNVQEALASLNENLPSLIISETFIGEPDGFKLCRLLKQEERTWHVPFIFITNAAEPDYAAEGIRAGAEDYITKPYNVEMVALKVNRIFQFIEKNNVHKNSQTGVYGRLEEMAFIEIVQILSGNSKSACISLKKSHHHGKVFIENGNIVNATLDNITGEQVVYTLMKWDKGEFMIKPLKEKVKRVIFDNTENILLEGCRLMDETEK